MKSEQMIASDTVYHWISETFEVDIQDKEAVRAALVGNIDLFKDYCTFCNSSGRQPKTINSFHSMLKSIYRVDQRRSMRGGAHVYIAVEL
jgi:phage/plasmid-associated DNA primase